MNNSQQSDSLPAPSNPSHVWFRVGAGGKAEPEDQTGVQPADIIGYTVSFFNLEDGCFSVKKRGSREYTDVKHMLRTVLRRKFPKMGLTEIAYLTCKTDHSTVISSLRKHDDGVRFNPEYRHEFERYLAALVKKGLVDA